MNRGPSGTCIIGSPFWYKLGIVDIIVFLASLKALQMSADRSGVN